MAPTVPAPLLTRRPSSHPRERTTPINSHLVSAVRITVIHIAHLPNTPLQYIIRGRIRWRSVGTSTHRPRRRAWDEVILQNKLRQFPRIQARMHILRGFCAVAANVGLCEGVAAEDVVDSGEGGGAEGGVASEVVGGGDDLDGVELVGVGACERG